ncbi:MAG: hypothetical protein AB7S38_20380 [Vulcanimicrobiota bacterium]
MGGVVKGVKSALKGAEGATKGLLKSGLEMASGRPDQAVKTLVTSQHNGVMDTLKGGHEIGKAVVPVAGAVAGGFFGGPVGSMVGGQAGTAVAGEMGKMDGVFDEMKIATNDNDFGRANGDLAAGFGPFA